MPKQSPSSRDKDAKILTGRLAEYQELLEVLAERPGLTVVSTDPYSGTSALLHAVVEELDGTRIIVDARRCSTSLDLAMGIADATVGKLASDAKAWWSETAPPNSTAGLKLARILDKQGVDWNSLRKGEGPSDRRLAEALELPSALAKGPVLLVVDHLGPLLSALNEESRYLLGELRAAHQKHGRLDLVLVEYPDGPAAKALHERDHPLYHAGASLPIKRAKPIRFVDDLAITHPSTRMPTEVIRTAAELANGVPALVWRIIELSSIVDGEDGSTQAFSGWRRLRQITDAPTARVWDLLRRIHPLAQTIVAALAVGLRPHAVEANPKLINDVLIRLRDLGLVWQPEPRRWALADPLLTAWVQDNPPPWAERRSF